MKTPSVLELVIPAESDLEAIAEFTSKAVEKQLCLVGRPNVEWQRNLFSRKLDAIVTCRVSRRR
jgi:hypothetical protein